MPLIIVEQAGGSSLHKVTGSHGRMGWRGSERPGWAYSATGGFEQ